MLFGLESRPLVCRQLKPEPDMCGLNAADALRRLQRLEQQTRPPDA